MCHFTLREVIEIILIPNEGLISHVSLLKG